MDPYVDGLMASTIFASNDLVGWGRTIGATSERSSIEKWGNAGHAVIRPRAAAIQRAVRSPASFLLSPMITPSVVADGGNAALVQTKFRATSSSVTSSAGPLKLRPTSRRSDWHSRSCRPRDFAGSQSLLSRGRLQSLAAATHDAHGDARRYSGRVKNADNHSMSREASAHAA